VASAAVAAVRSLLALAEGSAFGAVRSPFAVDMVAGRLLVPVAVVPAGVDSPAVVPAGVDSHEVVPAGVDSPAVVPAGVDSLALGPGRMQTLVVAVPAELFGSVGFAGSDLSTQQLDRAASITLLRFVLEGFKNAARKKHEHRIVFRLQGPNTYRFHLRVGTNERRSVSTKKASNPPPTLTCTVGGSVVCDRDGATCARR
jgi:hypothetical protein